MTCSKCKSLNLETARFCTRCGDPLLDSAAYETLAAHESAGATGPQSFEWRSGEGNEADRLIGRVIDGRYRVDASLGHGGMGVVYRATRLHIDDVVAIKFLRPELLTNPQSLERFRREAKAAARLKHPNVVTIHDFGITDDRIAYLVMELIEGQSVRELIDRHGSLTQSDTVEIACQVCEALGEAHRLGIIHRDLKPDNIIVTKATGGLRVSVLDFGIAKLRDLTTSDRSLTESGTVLGTPRYMSPEQCLGEELDGRSDIYSLGIVLYEMLSGVVPFNSPSLGALIMQQVNNPPPPLRTINLTIPPAVEAAVAGALEKRREDRPQSAFAFAEEIKAALSSEAAIPTIRRGAIGSQSSGARQFSPLAVTPSAASPGAAQTGSSQSPDSSKPARTQRARSRLLVTAIVAIVLAAVAVGWRLWTSDKQSASIGSDDAATTGADPASRGKSGARGEVDGVERMLAQAESDYRRHRYDAVIAACNDILAGNPDQPRADLLLGESYYNTGSARAAEYLARAIDMGETATLPIKHHHYEGVLKINEGLCSGYVKLRKATLEFHSELTAHDFTAPTDKIYDLRDESYRGGRLHLKVGIQRGGVEVAEDYNFYAPPAGLRKQMTIMRVFCENPACQPMAQTLYHLLARFKK
jgi:serine/threonine protein kinase